MTSLLHILASLALIGQIPFYGDIPEQVPTFKMTYPDGTEAYGALAVDGGWYMEDVVDLPQGTYPTIVFDTPWNPARDRVLRMPQFSREMLPLRKQRLAAQWKAAGFAEAPGTSGAIYAPAEEIELAQRARDMEAHVLAEVEGALAPLPTPPSTPAEPASMSAADYLQRWGLQALIAIIGLAATALVFKKMVLNA